MGDKGFLKLAENDVILTKSDWQKMETLSMNEAQKKFKVKAPSPINKKLVETSGSEILTDFSDSDASSDSYLKCKKSRKTMPASKINRRTQQNKLRKSKILSKHFKNAKGPPVEVKPGEKLVVTALHTRSEIEVVWQDGTLEKGIPSTELFPIQHLDEQVKAELQFSPFWFLYNLKLQEYFCGDFVVRDTTDSSVFRPYEYGVVQSVDHIERTARVKWFQTYTGADNLRPTNLDTSEEAVYELRDHPDFTFRPGSIVIQVANFENESDQCGGQVLEMDAGGQLSIRWSNGTTSLCWPQDIFKVGEYDSDDEDGLWGDDDEDDSEDSDASWETESEHSVSQEEV